MDLVKYNSFNNYSEATFNYYDIIPLIIIFQLLIIIILSMQIIILNLFIILKELYKTLSDYKN